MTIEAEIRRRLQQNGMALDSVEPCMEFIKSDPMMRPWRKRWSHEITEYQEEAIETLWHVSKSLAVEWMAAQPGAPVKGE